MSKHDDDLKAAARAALSMEDYIAELGRVARGRTDVRGRLRALAELARLAGYATEEVEATPARTRRTKFRGFLRSQEPGQVEPPRALPAGHRRRTTPKPRPTPGY